MARLRLRVDRYQQVMKAIGCTRQSQQARLLGVTEHTVKRVVRAGQEPGPRFIAGLKVNFPGVDIDYFLAAEPEPGDRTDGPTR